jgi:hypothetical protein
MSNPYESPRSASLAPDTGFSLPNLLTWRMFFTFAGLATCSVGAWFFHYSYTLRRDYPDLTDKSPDVDSYWPAVEHLISNVIATGATLVGLIVLAFAGGAFVRARYRRVKPQA